MFAMVATGVLPREDVVFGVGHEAEDVTGGIADTGDIEGGAVGIGGVAGGGAISFGVSEGDQAIGIEGLGGVVVLDGETAFAMGDGAEDRVG